MSQARFVAVIDVGKTNAKLALVDLEKHSEVAVRKHANIPISGDPYPHTDIAGIWDFVCTSLAELNAKTPIEAISITTHGASAVLVTRDGELALPMLDYEYSGPDEYDTDYAQVRPDFHQSLTPPLPDGLNLAKQLFWQSKKFPKEFARTKWILPYPQYWGFRLTGVAASEITSIGCHTDLWNFRTNDFSTLVERENWREKFAPIRPATDVLGLVKPELAAKLGLCENIPVHVGIHDSNASLLPHVMSQAAPFAVVSTGTWVVICAPGGDLENLDPARDSYSNIDAFGRHVPSARFMGGREYTELTDNVAQDPQPTTIEQVLKESWFLFPSICKGSGPFPQMKARTTFNRDDVSDEAFYAIVSFYLAMMTSECLSLAGAAGDIIVEGPFATNQLFLEMLQAATGRSVLAQKSNSTGTSIGAALLARETIAEKTLEGAIPVTCPLLSDMAIYAQKWREEIKTIRDAQ